MWPGFVDGLAVRFDDPTVRLFQAGNDVEQGRLSTPAGADEADKLAFCNPERHVIEGMHMQRAGLKPL
jgi:hypothetical protein